MNSELGEVFISYSHDSPEHIKQVLDLSNRLRSDGIDCVLDQYEASPPEGWPKWMDRKIRDAQYVLCICTEEYFKRVMGEVEENIGLGIKWEGGLIYQHIYNAGSENTRFIPVILSNNSAPFIPTPLQGATRYLLETDEDYEKLYKRLAGIPEHTKPPLGKLRALPTKEINPDTIGLLMSPINLELWDDAGWVGVFYGHFPDQPPWLGLVFSDETIAKRIFEEWQIAYGDRDEFEQIRIAIIEGDIEGEESGYSIVVGPNLENSLQFLEDKMGFSSADKEIHFLAISRVHRMNPPSDSPNLERFKRDYRKHKTYYLLPAFGKLGEGAVTPFPELKIFKGEITFRKVDEIDDTDMDYVIFLGSES